VLELSCLHHGLARGLGGSFLCVCGSKLSLIASMFYLYPIFSPPIVFGGGFVMVVGSY